MNVVNYEEQVGNNTFLTKLYGENVDAYSRLVRHENGLLMFATQFPNNKIFEQLLHNKEFSKT